MKSKNFKELIFLVMSIIVCAVWLVGEAIAQKKGYPEKQIDVIIGSSPGGSTDIGTRIIIEELQKELKVPIMAVYKGGGGGYIADLAIVNAKPDGYTLLSKFSSGLLIPPAMEKNPPFDPVNDVTQIAFCGAAPSIMAANSSSKLTSFNAMIKFAKENPGKLNCATSGIGYSGHFTLEYLRSKYGVDITHIPNKSATAAFLNLLGNHVDLATGSLTGASPHIKSGQLRGLVATNKLKKFPEVPTFAEVGFPELHSFDNWLGFFTPPNLPKPILSRLSVAFEKVMQLPSVVQSLENADFIPVYMGPEELKKRFTKEYEIIKEVARTSGLVK